MAKKMTEAERSRLDLEVLRALAGRCDVATYVIRNVLDWPGQPFYRTGLQTSQVLRSCRRLVRAGTVEEGRTRYLTQKAWRITPAGRSALGGTDA
jgi:hypothetical protein